jgi:hypothetical protein
MVEVSRKLVCRTRIDLQQTGILVKQTPIVVQHSGGSSVHPGVSSQFHGDSSVYCGDSSEDHGDLGEIRRVSSGKRRDSRKKAGRGVTLLGKGNAWRPHVGGDRIMAGQNHWEQYSGAFRFL